MNKSLEALKRISNHKCYEKECSCWDYISTLYKNEIQTIKQDLERKEELEKENQELKEELQLTETARQLIYNELKCCSGISEYIEKLKKAIDIIKNHDIRPINHLGTLRFAYNEFNSTLTQQEYELLKEILN